MNRRGARPSRTRLWVTTIVVLLLVSAGIYCWFNMVTIQLLLLRQTNFFLDENLLNWESMGGMNQTTKSNNNTATTTATAGGDQKETNHAKAHITTLSHDNNNDNNDMLLLPVVFYNLYNPANETKEENSNTTAIEQAVRNIMEEQLLVSNRNHAIRKIFIRSIGHRKLQPLINGTILLQHDENGTELETLGYLWDYCKSHPHEKVVYLHSKGSFHPSEKNDALRRFLTRGALSEECGRNLPDWCNVCSSRMSPLPHVHAPGNMWLARCHYVNHLIDPRLFPQEMERIKNVTSIPPRLRHCHGIGRYAAEHWIHSHPLVSSCDLSNDKDFVWGYIGIPSSDFKMELKLALRFNFSMFVPDKNHCGYTKDAQNITSYGNVLLEEYKVLYGGERNISSLALPPKQWFGWDFFNLKNGT